MRAQAAGSPGVSDADAPDIIITEIGGTVGDIESLPFLEAARQVRHDLGRDNVFFLHVSLVPYLAPSGELKTKPTQHSVAALRQVGIQPDALVLRADREIPESIKRKISLMCDVDTEAVAAAVDAPSIYDIPKVLHREGLDAYVIRRLGLTFRDVDWTDWDLLLERVHEPEHEVTVALVGKYIDLPDAYLSVTEALRAGGFHHDAKVQIRWVASDTCDTEAGAQRALGGVDAVLVPGGFGVRGYRGQGRRPALGPHRLVPTLGICLGLQCMVIEYARDVAGIEGASSTEFDPKTRLRSSRRWRSRRPSSRVPATWAARCGWVRSGLRCSSPDRSSPGVRCDVRDERHRHRYEVNNDYRQQLEDAGLVVQRHPPRAGARRVRRAAGRGAPLLRLDTGPPRVQVAARRGPTRCSPVSIGAALEAQRASRLVEVERPRHHEAADAHA
jgi:CTP synthase